jgi:hypothetical protein
VLLKVLRTSFYVAGDLTVEGLEMIGPRLPAGSMRPVDLTGIIL